MRYSDISSTHSDHSNLNSTRYLQPPVQFVFFIFQWEVILYLIYPKFFSNFSKYLKLINFFKIFVNFLCSFSKFSFYFSKLKFSVKQVQHFNKFSVKFTQILFIQRLIENEWDCSPYEAYSSGIAKQMLVVCRGTQYVATVTERMFVKTCSR